MAGRRSVFSVAQKFPPAAATKTSATAASPPSSRYGSRKAGAHGLPTAAPATDSIPSLIGAKTGRQFVWRRPAKTNSTQPRTNKSIIKPPTKPISPIPEPAFIGATIDLSEHDHILLSAGRSFDGPIDFQCYVAWQFTFDNSIFHF